MLKKIIIIIGILLLGGALAGYYMWNKPHRDVTNEQAIQVDASQLASDYEANQDASNAKYLNKAVQVHGTIKEISKNQDGAIIVILDDVMTGVQCTMKDKNVSLSEEEMVTLKGICNGYTIGVSMSDCVLIN